MIVQDVRKSREAPNVETLAAIVTFETPAPRSFRVYFRFEDAPEDIGESADPFLIGFLAPAMLLGEDIRIHGIVDPELLASIRLQIIPLLRKWAPCLSNIEIEADEERAPPIRDGRGLGVAAFSGGLDAMYTTVKLRDRIDWIVASQGFDTRTYQKEYWNKIRSNIEDAARTISKPLMTVQTNLREISHYEAIRTRNGNIDPAYYALGHNGPIGPYLIAIAYCLRPACSHFAIASDTIFEDLYPYGSHPLLDPMWSTSQLQVIHNGCESSRIEKIAYLKETCPESLKRLRVCWTPHGTKVNCGKCEKCIRTMAELQLADAMHLAETFDWPIRTQNLRGASADSLREHYWETIYEAAMGRGNRELARTASAMLGIRRVFGLRWRNWKQNRNRTAEARARWQYTRRIMKPPAKDLYEVPTPE